MKSIFLAIATLLYTQTLQAQLKTTTAICPTFSVDVLEGILNNAVTTKSTLGQVKKFFPCFTEEVEQATATKCSGIFYADKGIYFYNDRGYIEVRENFKGKLIPQLMGVARGSLFKTLGNPKMKDVAWDAFETKYGILILYYNKAGKINKLQLSSKSTDTIKLCEQL
jgi:hypothetical protein